MYMHEQQLEFLKKRKQKEKRKIYKEKQNKIYKIKVIKQTCFVC